MTMKYNQDNLYAYRLYEKKDGPLAVITGVSLEEAISLNYLNLSTELIKKLYNSRRMFEQLMYRLFIQNGGKPKTKHPYYFAIYEELPYVKDIFEKYKEAECLKVPMDIWNNETVSFTYGYSYDALVRKDHHPTQRKLLLLDEVYEVMNRYPYTNDGHIWFEMQVWDDDLVTKLYNNGNSKYIIRNLK